MCKLLQFYNKLNKYTKKYKQTQIIYFHFLFYINKVWFSKNLVINNIFDEQVNIS